MNKISFVLGLALALAPIGTATTSADGGPVVTITDTGYSPAAVTVAPGAPVTWINKGNNVHTVTTIGGAPLPYDSGGVGPGQSTSAGFSLPGSYWYTSATDCLNGASSNIFPCTVSFLVTVAAGGVTSPNPSPAPPAAVPAPVVALPAPAAPVAAAPVPASPAASPSQYPWHSKSVSTPPVDCGAQQVFIGWLVPHAVPCVDSAPNAGTQYVQGHVLDNKGNGVSGMIVRVTAYGNTLIDTGSDQDGTFSAVLSTDCPAARTYSVFIVDSQGRQSSDAYAVNYTSCNVAGEFHFDFIQS
ncbi:MAG TPA: hypothetical protein VF157_09635 [Chloroflexota bacterium]